MKELFNKLFKIETEQDLVNPDLVKMRLVMGLSIVGFMALTTLGVVNLKSGEHVAGIGEVIGGLILFMNSFLSRKGYTEITSFIGILILFLVCVYVFITGGYKGTGIFWLFTFPTAVFSLRGVRSGMWWLTILFVYLGGMFIVQQLGILDLIYSVVEIYIVFASLFVVSILTYIYQNIQETGFKIITEQSELMKSANISLDNAVTKKVIAEQELQKSLQKINAMLNSIGDGVFVLDEHKKILMVNPMTSELSGYDAAELLGTQYNDKLKFVFDKTKEPNAQFIDDVYEKGVITQMGNETVLIQKDKKELAVGDSAAPIKDQNGKVIGCVVVFRDMTKEREIDKMKTEFVSIASHQLKTPVAGVQWFLELLTDNKSKNLTAEQKDYLQEIANLSKKMNKLVSDLLDVSRIDTGKKFTIEKKKQDLVEVVKEAIKDEELKAKERAIKVKLCDKCPKSLNASIDAYKLGQMLHNLINNAIKYSPKGETVELFVEKKGGNVEIRVQDHGYGIPKRQQKRVFEKFFRADNVAAKDIEGTGLGLYIVKAIVDGHGGSITFESEEEKGTTFIISLPQE